MKNHWKLITFGVVLALVGGLTLAQPGKAQSACPVSAKAIDRSVFVDHQGQRIFFCCRGCPAAFKADPEKFYAQFARDGVALENIQTSCPVSGEALGGHGEATSVSYKGRTVKLCCAACEKPFVREPEKYLDKLPGEKL
ncbi:MAG: hypothetical protein HRF46_11920 [Acidobacteriota bacterium]|jgi:YHS domain-containing protein